MPRRAKEVKNIWAHHKGERKIKNVALPKEKSQIVRIVFGGKMKTPTPGVGRGFGLNGQPLRQKSARMVVQNHR